MIFKIQADCYQVFTVFTLDICNFYILLWILLVNRTYSDSSKTFTEKVILYKNDTLFLLLLHRMPE